MSRGIGPVAVDLPGKIETQAADLERQVFTGHPYQPWDIAQLYSVIFSYIEALRQSALDSLRDRCLARWTREWPNRLDVRKVGPPSRIDGGCGHVSD